MLCSKEEKFIITDEEEFKLTIEVTRRKIS